MIFEKIFRAFCEPKMIKNESGQIAFEEIPIDTWSKAKESFREFMFGPNPWVFRGMSNSSWRIMTSFERNLENVSQNILSEHALMVRFLRNAHNHIELSKLPENDFLETLSIMQHHGAPTRLLDWTDSAYIAAFFAFDDALQPDSHCAIWAISPSFFRVQAQSLLKALKGMSLDSMPANFGEKDIFNNLYRNVLLNNELDGILPVKPFRINSRLEIQQGSFIIPLNANIPFESNFQYYSDEEMRRNIKKFILPSSLRSEVITDLHFMNITAGSLFPGFDGFAQSLKNILIVEDYLIAGS